MHTLTEGSLSHYHTRHPMTEGERADMRRLSVERAPVYSLSDKQHNKLKFKKIRMQLILRLSVVRAAVVIVKIYMFTM